MSNEMVVLMSGGPDSFVTAEWARRSGYDPVGLFFDAGHEVARKERDLVEKQTKYLDIEFDTLEIGDLSRSLREVSPTAECDHFFKGHGLTLFPFSAGITASIAASYAMSQDIATIAYGLHADDFDQSDQYTPDVLEAIAAAAREEGEVDVVLPFETASKRKVVARADQWGLPIEMSWSCTHSEREHCGDCVQCEERFRVLSGPSESAGGSTGELEPEPEPDPELELELERALESSLD